VGIEDQSIQFKVNMYSLRTSSKDLQHNVMYLKISVAKFEVRTVILMKNRFLGGVTSHGIADCYRRFGRACYRHPQSLIAQEV
jgi:hypothetical protein